TVGHVRDTPTYPNDWAKLVDELTRRPGWSKARLAREAGVDRRTVHRWISGESANVSADSIRRISEASTLQADLVARAALGAQKQQAAADDEAIAEVMASGIDDEYKQEIVEHIRRKRAEAEAALRRDIDIMLRRPRRDQAS